MDTVTLSLNNVDVNASVAELNKLSGLSLTTADLNKITNLTSSTEELDLLHKQPSPQMI